MTREDHLKAALKRSRKAHKATIEQAKKWKKRYVSCHNLYEREIATLLKSRDSWHLLYDKESNSFPIATFVVGVVVGTFALAILSEALK